MLDQINEARALAGYGDFMEEEPVGNPEWDTAEAAAGYGGDQGWDMPHQPFSGHDNFVPRPEFEQLVQCIGGVE